MPNQHEIAPAQQLIETLRDPSAHDKLWVVNSLQEFLESSYGIELALADRFDCDKRDTGEPIATYSFGSTSSVAIRNYLRKFSTEPTAIFSEFDIDGDTTQTRHIVPGVALGTRSKAVETKFSFSAREGLEARRNVLKLRRQVVGSSLGQVVCNPFEEQTNTSFSGVKVRDNSLGRGLRAGHFRTI